MFNNFINNLKSSYLSNSLKLDNNCKLNTYWKYSIYLKFLLPIIILSISLCILGLGYTIPKTVPVEDINDFINGIFIVPLSIVGIIIPITLLVINSIISKNPSFLVKYILENEKPLLVVLIIFIFFILSILLNFAKLQGYIQNNEIYLILGLTFVLIALVQSLVLIINTIRFLNDNFLYKQIIKEVSNNILENTCLEKNSKDIILPFQDKAKENDFKVVQSLPYNYNELLIELKLDHSISYKEFIEDINLKSLERLRSLLQNEIDEKTFGIFLIPKHRYSDKKIKFYVNKNEKNLKYIKFWANRVFKIKKYDIKLVLDPLKDSIIDAIKKNEENKLEKLIDVYSKSLRGLCKKISFYGIEYLDLKDKFISINLIGYDLQDLIKIAIENRNERIIEIFAYKFFRISKNAIINKNYIFLKSFIDIYYLIYDFAFIKDKKKAKEVSIKYLTKIIEFLNENKDDSDYNKLLSKYTNLLEIIIRNSFKNDDNDAIDYLNTLIEKYEEEDRAIADNLKYIINKEKIEDLDYLFYYR